MTSQEKNEYATLCDNVTALQYNYDAQQNVERLANMLYDMNYEMDSCDFCEWTDAAEEFEHNQCHYCASYVTLCSECGGKSYLRSIDSHCCLACAQVRRRQKK